MMFFFGLDGQCLVGGDVLSPCGLVNLYDDVVILLFDDFLDVQGEMEAVPFGVWLYPAEGAKGKSLVVFAEVAFEALAFDNLKCHEHYILDLFVCRYIEMVEYLVLFE